MSTWADDTEVDLHNKEEDDLEYDYDEEDGEDSYAAWEDAKEVTEMGQDEEGNAVEITKLVRSEEIVREVTPADLRARFKPFGKGLEEKPAQPAVIGLPLAYTMPTPFEKESRDELRGYLAEKFDEERFVQQHPVYKRAKAARDENAGRRRQQEAAASGDDRGLTYADMRAAGGARPAEAANDDHEYRVRVTNLVDTISEENLRDLFDRHGRGIIKSVHIIKDKETGNYKGFAFITFTSKEEREKALREKAKGILYKDVNLIVSPAVAQVKRP